MGLGFRRLRVEGLGFRVGCLGFRASGLGGSRLPVSKVTLRKPALLVRRWFVVV